MFTLIEGIKDAIFRVCIGEEILYIGGQDILPAPLSKDEEEELLLHIAFQVVRTIHFRCCHRPAEIESL